MAIKPRLIKPISIKPKKPANLKEALDFYHSHINSVYTSYIVLVSDLSKNLGKEIVQPMQSFELLLGKAFNEDCYQSKELLEYVQELVIVEKEKLELYYNQIVLNLNKLLNELIDFEIDIKYPITETLFEPFYFEMLELIQKTSNTKDVNGKWIYKEVKYFTSKNLINQIRKDVSDLINDIDNVFTYKEFNKTKKIETNTTPIQKEIKPIKWLKNSVLLAYLINELKTYGFIEEENIWAICEQIFVDKNGKPIKAETFTSMVKNYERNQTTDNTKGKPKNHKEITELIEIIKKVSKEI